MLSDGETSVQAIVTEVGQSQPEVSYHLALLRHTNLVASRRESGRYLYSLTGVGQDFADHLQRLMSPKPVSRRVVKVRAEIDTVPRKDVRETMDDAKVRLNSSETSSWEDLNRHRLNLIDKEVDQELTVEEEAELHVLQQKADDYLDIVAPLPFEILDKLRECAQEDGLDVSFLEEE